MNDLKVIVTDEFVEECKALIVETEFSARWALVEGYHRLGEMILQEVGVHPLTEFTASLATKLKKSERTIWYAVKFARDFPSLATLPEGKNTNWNKIIKKYLTVPTPPTTHDCEYVTICRVCKEPISVEKARELAMKA